MSTQVSTQTHPICPPNLSTQSSTQTDEGD
nr:MAG TPA: hypothetical protein [Caudoviricetes sp.]